MKRILFLFFSFAIISTVSAQGLLEGQQDSFTRQDTLRGSITPERSWWDLLRYDLNVKVFPSTKSIEGTNTVTFKVLEPGSSLQIDLQEPLEITEVIFQGKAISYQRDGNAYFLDMPSLNPESVYAITISYQGVPVEAVRPPWDGGLTWNQDKNGNDFIATSCQGLGASVWWPCKDHMYDEPDNGMLMTFVVPENLIAVGNGRLKKSKKADKGYKAYTWEVNNPINNYGVNMNIGDYVSWEDTYAGEKGDLDLQFWVLKDNLENAKKHFQDAYRTLEALEYWFGPYPFYEDGYKLVEVPYLGMEHQSSVTYGNQYKKGYLGNDLSMTGQGLKWDFIIVHESGHEWFANNITYKDIADMWIHEGFTSYSESLFMEYHYGKEAAAEYTRGLRTNIENVATIIGPYGVNEEGHGDMYYKGHNMLHMIRQIINDDDQWRSILRGLNQKFYHQTVDTKDIEDYISRESGIDFSPVFDQYLRDYRIPIFEYRLSPQGLLYKWGNCVEGFNMKVKIQIDGKEVWLDGKDSYSYYQVQNPKEVVVNPDFYVANMNTLGN